MQSLTILCWKDHGSVFDKSMSEPTIIISGAGVAGLLLALALKKIGMSVSVYEQSPQFSDGVGGNIVCQVSI